MIEWIFLAAIALLQLTLFTADVITAIGDRAPVVPQVVEQQTEKVKAKKGVGQSLALS